MANNARNPYIVGTPIDTPDKLFGRDSLFQTIEQLLLQDTKLILLHGQRRIGKSSVLKNIPLKVASQEQFYFAHYDLQDHVHSSLNQILHAIATNIFENLNLDSSRLSNLLDINSDKIIFRNFRNILVSIYERIGHKNLVLLLDEFDVVTQNDTEQALQFLRFLEDLVKREEELFVIAVVGRYRNYIPNFLQTFKGAPSQEIGLLSEENATKLIHQPAYGTLQYDSKTVNEILKFSSGHPYYTQVLCRELFNLARERNDFIIAPEDVQEVIQQALGSAEGGLGSSWAGLSIFEKVVILTVAEVQADEYPENPLKLLEDYGLVVTDDLEQAVYHLIDKGFLNNNPVKVKVELMRLWLIQRHRLRDEIRELEAIESENINNFLRASRDYWDKNKQSNALEIYEQILRLNPNHFSTISELANRYLQIKNFDKVLPLYERAYKLDSAVYQQEFTRALNEYAHFLITQINYEKAYQQCEKILQLDPDNLLAQQKIEEIKAFQSSKNQIEPENSLAQPLVEENTTVQSSNNSTNNTFRLRQLSRLPKVLLVLLLLVAGSGMIFGIQRVFSNCSTGQGGFFGIACNSKNPSLPPDQPSIKDSISRGDRTLFPNIKNLKKEQGITSFKEQNYRDAAQYFLESRQTNLNDPELLIYLNNALANQKGNPLTLAAVVPAMSNRSDAAQEVLRGVAQAQNQFNEQGGLNGRLLEIVIADDGNDIEKAKQVVQEIVLQYKSILGVIGHNSSDVTNEVLSIYQENGLPVISATSSGTKLQNQVFFRTTPTDQVTAKKLAEHLSEINIKKAVIFCNSGVSYKNYSDSLREEFRTEFAKTGGDLLNNPQSQCLEISNPKSAIEKAKHLLYGEQPMAIVLFPATQNLSDAIEITKTIKEVRENMSRQTIPNNIRELKFIGGDSLYSEKIIQQGGSAVEGLVLAVPWFRDNPTSKQFAQNADKFWGGKISWRTATSFDATLAFIESFRLSGNPTKETVLQNLPRVMVSSDTTQRKATLIIVKEGKFVKSN